MKKVNDLGIYWDYKWDQKLNQKILAIKRDENGFPIVIRFSFLLEKKLATGTILKDINV